MMFPMTAGQFDLVYNSLSFTLASMMASTIFFWLRLSSVHEKYKSAMTITGLVTFIAACALSTHESSHLDAPASQCDASLCAQTTTFASSTRGSIRTSSPRRMPMATLATRP